MIKIARKLPLGVHIGASRRTITWVPDRLPDSRELAAWREFLRAHSRLTRTLETELVTDALAVPGGL